MSAFIPEDARCIVLGTSIETAGDVPGDHALMAIGVAVVAITPRGPKVVHTERFGGWKIGSRRFSVTCAARFLTYTDDESGDRDYWIEKRAMSAHNNYSDLHTYPRVQPFAYEGRADTSEDEIENELEAYEKWRQFRQILFDECDYRIIHFVQVVDDKSVNHGWFMYLASKGELCPPTHLFRTVIGECCKRVFTREIDEPIESFVRGYCRAKAKRVPEGRAYHLLRLALEDEIALPPCPAKITHIPEEDAIVHAWAYAMLWHVQRGGKGFDQ